MDCKRTGGHEGVPLPLDKLAIHQTSQVVRYVPAKHKHYNINISHDQLSDGTRVHVPAKSDCTCCKGDHYQEENCNCGQVRIITVWLNQHRNTHT